MISKFSFDHECMTYKRFERTIGKWCQGWRGHSLHRPHDQLQPHKIASRWIMSDSWQRRLVWAWFLFTPKFYQWPLNPFWRFSPSCFRRGGNSLFTAPHGRRNEVFRLIASSSNGTCPLWLFPWCIKSCTWSTWVFFVWLTIPRSS